MSVQKLTTGSAYTYLTDSVARNDLDSPSTTPLADYYDERGEAPGPRLRLAESEEAAGRV